MYEALAGGCLLVEAGSFFLLLYIPASASLQRQTKTRNDKGRRRKKILRNVRARPEMS